MNFSNAYLSLGSKFYQRIRPKPVKNPSVFLWNHSLAKKLMISDIAKNNLNELAQIFSGNHLPPDLKSIATVYAGHQFGHFVPQLGDGRAHLLGELTDMYEKKWELQLKGSGPTLFSRNGDGRCTLKAAVREFIMSEAMNALRIPTTRCLAVISTGETVIRESALAGAIVVRIASSHIRIGTFEFFAAQNDYESVEKLCNYILQHYYQKLKNDFTNRYVALIDAIIEKQIKMVVEWMRVGFIHGVMNTDNISINGETIDYGPCAMMGIYNPKTVYSSIDINGRYAFENQPKILEWNINRFVECLIPLKHIKKKKALKEVGDILQGFSARFKKEYMKMMGKKIGIVNLKNNEEDKKIVFSLLKYMEKKKDYTIFFNLLTKSLTSEIIFPKMSKEFNLWFDNWLKRLKKQDISFYEVKNIMKQYNPLIIPRNHHIEEIIKDCELTKRTELARDFIKVLKNPYKKLPNTENYQDPPRDGDKFYKTFCGT